MATDSKSKAVRGPQLELGDKGHSILVRLPPGMNDKLKAAILIEARTMPMFSRPSSVNGICVAALAEYIAQWESIAASPEARDAAAVLNRVASRKKPAERKRG